MMARASTYYYAEINSIASLVNLCAILFEFFLAYTFIIV